MSGPTPGDVPGPADLPAEARRRVVAVLADLERDRAALAAAGDAGGVAAYDDLIDAARRVLDSLDSGGRVPVRD